MKNLLPCLLLFIFQLIFKFSFGQLKIAVYKDRNVNGSFINIEVKKNRILDSIFRKSYYFPEVYRLDDSVKILIIEKILKFTSDTSICSNPVIIYENPSYPGCYDLLPSSKTYPLKIEALFIITRIAYNNFSFRIGCYPVLFDTLTQKEVNNNIELINIMVEHYKEWFQEYKFSGKLPDYKFLNSGRIRWWGRHFN